VTAALLERIAALEAEVVRLKRGAFEPSGTVVEVPPESRELFDRAASTLHRYFSQVDVDPARAMIGIENERYVLIRASALSVNFLDGLAHLYADRGPREALAIGRGLLFDLAHTIGIHDARALHERLGHTEPIEKLSSGPVHFAYTGWAKVDIKPQSHPSPDDDFCLVYEHPYSFEADSFIRAKRSTEGPVCIMGSGYSSGWCEESFGIELTAVEVTCRARGDAACTFVMAPPHRVRERVREHFGVDVDVTGSEFDIPTYFERKRAEETVRESLRHLKEAKDELVRKERLAAVGLLVASVAHEINTPLGIAVTAMSVLADELVQLESKFSENQLNRKDLRVFLERASEAASLMASNLDRAAVQVSNLRRASVDQESQELVEVDLVAYVQQTLENLKPIARQGQLDVTFRSAATRILAITQPGAIAQLLTNFLTNSATHGRHPDEARRLAVTVSLAPDDQKGVVLVYEDDGRGMSEEIRQQAFQPFFTTARTKGGSGLGLYIVQSLVSDVLRGTVRLHTSPGAGVRFEIEVPIHGREPVEVTP
jgi:signal transduction histidine kinase